MILRKGKFATDDTQREDRGKDWSDAATSQETPGATRSWKRQGRALL